MLSTALPSWQELPHNQKLIQKFNPELFDCRWLDCHKNTKIRNELVTENLPLVKHFLSKWFGKFTDDLLAAGYESLIKAVEKYNPRQFVRFSTFARKFIWFSVCDFLTEQTQIIKAPRDCEPVTYEPLDLEQHDTPAPDSKHDGAIPNYLLDQLDERERMVIRLKFEQDWSRKKIAEKLNVSPPMINKIINKALPKLKQQLQHQVDFSS